MKFPLFTGVATAALLSFAPTIRATPALTVASSAPNALFQYEAEAQDLLVQVKNDKSNGQKGKKPKKAKGPGKAKSSAKKEHPGKGNKPDKAQRVENGKKPKKEERADRGNKPDKVKRADRTDQSYKERRAYSDQERRDIVRRIIDVPAPQGRDMLTILGATALGLLGSNVAYGDIRDEDFYTYRNCPPGLAKKDPPCVPPGLAKKGVGYDEWISYDDERLNDIWLDRRRSVLDTDRRGDPDLLLLQSDQIASLYNLGAAPRGQQYALIDGLPVLLDDDDYRSLLLVNQLAQVPQLGSGISVAPTAALTQSELSRLYRLPQAGPDVNYSVLNGQLVQLTDSQYETLQLIRIARAIL